MWFIPKPLKNVSCSSIVVNNTEVDHQKYLGIIFDKKSCWDNQVNDVCKQIAYYLHLLSIHWNLLKYSILELLSESLIFSRISYMLCQCGVLLWERIKFLACNICKIELFGSLNLFDHVSSHCRELGCLTWYNYNLLLPCITTINTKKYYN